MWRFGREKILRSEKGLLYKRGKENGETYEKNIKISVGKVVCVCVCNRLPGYQGQS